MPFQPTMLNSIVSYINGQSERTIITVYYTMEYRIYRVQNVKTPVRSNNLRKRQKNTTTKNGQKIGAQTSGSHFHRNGTGQQTEVIVLAMQKATTTFTVS